MSSVSEKKIEKRNKILDCAYKLFTANTFTSTAIDDVVKMAGIAKGTFYLYFKDKYDLLDQIITRKSADLIREAVTSIEGDTKLVSPSQRVEALANYIIDYLVRHKEFTALLDKNFSHCLNIIIKGNNPEYEALLNSLVGIFTNGEIKGSDAKIKIYLFTELIGSVCCDTILCKGPFTVDDVRYSLINSVKTLAEVTTVD